MIPRAARHVSSSSSANVRTGIRNLVLGAESKHEDASYQSSRTFEDSDASPSPLGSRRSSMNAPTLAGRRDSFRAAFGMTSFPHSSTQLVSARSITTSATTVATPLAAAADAAPSKPAAESAEHGSYEFTPRELDAVKKRVEEESLLKSVAKDGGVAEPKRLDSKIPFEFPDASREVIHPSGFVVPSPGDAPTTHATDSRVRQPEINRGIPESVATFADLKELATAEQSTRSGKVPQEILGAHGVVEHPSGFIPPSPQHPEMEEVKYVFKPAVDLDTSKV